MNYKLTLSVKNRPKKCYLVKVGARILVLAYELF